MSVNPNVLELLSWQYRQKAREYQKFLDNLRTPKVQTAEDSLEYGEALTTASDLWKIFKTELDSARFSHFVINGAPGSGKSSAAREVMHNAHLDGYKMLYSSGLNVLESPLKLKAEAAGADKVAVCYDDLSYALNTVSSKKGSTFKNYFSMQRHWFDNAKVFNITIGHYTTALPPLLKNAGVWLYPHLTSLELDFVTKQCRSKTLRAQLDKCVNALSGIQKMLHDSGPVMDFTLYGKQYNGFTWDKNGRIQLAVIHGMPKLYLSQNKFCSECEKIAFSPRIDPSDYDIHKDGSGNTDVSGSGGDSA